ncbi:MAG: hypothetical protein LBD62_00085 [Candidatus Margulisbacteria bacterium]|jgi:hypothetical protein|nr:hypothetical protein [Candidatus Margulisiibacteriota bacterium]
MFITRKNIAARLLGIPGKIISSLRSIICEEKIKYCECVLKPQIEKAELIRRSIDSIQFDNPFDFGRVVAALEWIIYKNTADAPLATELLQDIAEQERQFRTKYSGLADFMQSDYQEKIIKKILADGEHAKEREEKIKQSIRQMTKQPLS